MNLRQRLLLLFSLTVIVAVAAVAYIVSLRTREAFAQADHLGQETSLEVTGIVREDKRAPGGRELKV
jgi:aspartyl/asparaginyl-tRNA synthetase